MSLMEEEDASPFTAGAPPGAAPRTSVGEYSDMIIARSTIPGYVSFRNTGMGAWFIQDLTKVFMENAHDMTLMFRRCWARCLKSSTRERVVAQSKYLSSQTLDFPFQGLIIFLSLGFTGVGIGGSVMMRQKFEPELLLPALNYARLGTSALLRFLA